MAEPAAGRFPTGTESLTEPHRTDLLGDGPHTPSIGFRHLPPRYIYINQCLEFGRFIVQKLCESRGGRPGLAVLTSLLVSVDVKLY